jgi:PAS domain S-box-containing protein
MRDYFSTQKAFSLHGKLLVPLFLLGTVAIISFTWMINHTFSNALEKLERQRADQLVHAINYAIEMVDKPESLQRLINALGAKEDVNLILVIAGNPQRIIAATDSNWLGKAASELQLRYLNQELQQAQQLQQPLFYYHNKSKQFNYTVPLKLSKQLGEIAIDTVIVIYLNTIQMEQNTYQANWQIFIWTVSLITLLMLFIYALFKQIVLKPTNAIGAAITQRLAGNQTAYAPLLAHDEIGALADMFNTLLEKQEKIETELRKLALVAKHTDNAVIISDAQVKIEWVNEGFTRITGYTLAEVVGKRAGVFLQGPKTNSATLAYIRQALQRGEGFQAELLNYGKTGRQYWIAIEVQPIRNEQGQIIYFIAIERDITQRKEAEEKLRQQTQIIDQTHDSVISTDIDYHINSWNKGAERSFGYTSQEIIGKHIDLLIQAEKREVYKKIIFEPLFVHSNHEIEISLLKKSGEEFFVHLSLSLLKNDEGEVTGFIGFAIDISERKRLEEALKAERTLLAQRVEERTAALTTANTELAKANHLKDEFLASMSHELRTPLNSILGLTEVLIEQLPEKVNEAQLKSLNIIYNSGKHLLSLINDILDLAKIEAGKAELQMTVFNLIEVVNASLLAIKPLAQKKQLQVLSNLPNDYLTLCADQQRIRQILINLLNNAVKFTPEGGTITLAVAMEPPTVKMSVADTGIGIATEHLSRLFKPFEQLDGGLARQFEGTGLGLTLVQRLVEMHRGSVQVVSEVGKGSCFTVTLPHLVTLSDAVPSPVAASTTHSLQKSSGKFPLILLVEESQSDIEMFQEYCREVDYRLILARRETEVFSRLGDEVPALMLLNIQISSMDGLEVARRVREHEEYLHLPIIALIAVTMPGDRERCLEAGINDYLSKPINPSELTSIMERYLVINQ